uniref:Uncharacterized protein n=1 Tax=Anguilla anguilla TaxID=7936 RepID=A0A0E9URR1_ANGAN
MVTYNLRNRTHKHIILSIFQIRSFLSNTSSFELIFGCTHLHPLR